MALPLSPLWPTLSPLPGGGRGHSPTYAGLPEGARRLVALELGGTTKGFLSNTGFRLFYTPPHCRAITCQIILKVTPGYCRGALSPAVSTTRSLWEVRVVSSQSRERGRAGATGVDSPPSCPQERPVGPRPPLGRFSPLPWLALSAPRNHAGAWNTGERRDVAFVPRGLLEGGGPRSNPTSPGSQASVSPA